MLFHAKYAANPEKTIVIQSEDTQACFMHSPLCQHLTKELWFCTVVKDRLRFVPIHDVCQNLEDRVLEALPAIHALTGCDRKSSISGIGNEVDPKGKCDEDLGDWSKSEYGDLEGVWSSGEEGVDSGNGKEKDQWGGQGRMNEERPYPRAHICAGIIDISSKRKD
ncbi:hypothetical protein ACROYT_G015096 [Oculina patagonica]